MREADMKCKRADCLLLTLLRSALTEVSSPLRFPPIAGKLTRSRKLVAESAFCCQPKHILWIFSAQTKWASGEMTDEKSQQKRLFSQMLRMKVAL